MIPASNPLIRKLEILNDLSLAEEGEAHNFKKKLDILHELTLALLDEIEALETVRTVNLRNGIDLQDELRRFEVHLIQSALERTGGHQTRAAKLLGINLTTLHNKLKRLNISPDVKTEAAVLHEDAGEVEPVELHSYNGRRRDRTVPIFIHGRRPRDAAGRQP